MFLLLLVPFVLYAQRRDSVYVKTQIFEVGYSETKEQPLWVKYVVKCPDGSASRKGMDFYKVPNFHTSDNNDYAGNQWDKGHMAPAADFNCTTEMLKQTFTYLNCSLQQENLNRGAWRFLEAYERKFISSLSLSFLLMMYWLLIRTVRDWGHVLNKLIFQTNLF